MLLSSLIFVFLIFSCSAFMLGSGNSCQLFDYGPESYENMPPDDITSPVIFVSKGFPYCKNIISVSMWFIIKNKIET